MVLLVTGDFIPWLIDHACSRLIYLGGGGGGGLGFAEGEVETLLYPMPDKPQLAA